MTVNLVLRLLREPLRADRLVGHAEIVATGESHPIRDVEDLLAVARAASDVPSPDARTRPSDAPATAPEDPAV